MPKSIPEGTIVKLTKYKLHFSNPFIPVNIIATITIANKMLFQI